MKQTVEAFLAELKLELESDLRPNQSLAILQETESHLRERIEAMVELGVPVHEAEAQTIQRFGKVREYAREISAANGTSPAILLKPVRATAVLACIAAGLTVAFCRGWNGGLVVVVPSLFLLAVAATSFRAARLDFWSFAKIGLGGCAATWAVMSVFWVRADGNGVFELKPRSSVNGFVRDLTADGNRLKASATRFEAATQAFRKGTNKDLLTLADTFQLRSGDQVLVPPDRILEPGAVTVADIHFDKLNPEQGAERWRRNGDQYVAAAMYSATAHLDWAQEFDHAANGGYVPNFLRMWVWGAIFVPFALVPLWIANFVGVALGALSRAARRWKRRRMRHV